MVTEEVTEALSRLKQIGNSLRDVGSKGNVSSKLSLGLLLIDLKRRSREAFLSAKKVESSLEEAKKEVEAKLLSLQNLQYEQSYLLREIERCSNFEMKENSKIPMVSEEEFFQTAPSHLLQDLEQSLEGDERSHQKELARLSHELFLRKELEEKLHQLNRSKEEISQKTAQQKDFLDELPRKMKSIVDATKDIQEHFGQPILERLGKHEQCKQLPNPLYMIFCQLEAYGDAFGGVSVSIEEKQDHSTSTLQHNDQDGTNGKEKEEELHEETRPGEKQTSVKRKRSESGSQDNTSTKARKGLDGKALKSDTKENGQREDAGMYVDSGVAVKALLQSKNKQVDVTLRFAYFEKLNVVTVEAIDQVGLLANLYPNDTGQYLPHLLMRSTGVKGEETMGKRKFPESMRGRPYKWLQWLAGIYQLSPEGPQEVQQPSMQRIVQSILDRVGAQESLSDQLKTLERRPHPVPVHKSAEHLFPPSAGTKLTKWVELNPEEADKRIGKASVSRTKGVPIFFRDENAKREFHDSEGGQSWAAFGRRCFHGVLKTKGKVTYEAIVQVFVDYPRRAPKFTLFPSDDPVLRLIEREVNDYADELHAMDELSLLSHQLRRLQMCLDVASVAASSEEGTSADTGEQHGHSSSASSIDRMHRGRDRRLAFVYDSQSRTFVHR